MKCEEGRRKRGFEQQAMCERIEIGFGRETEEEPFYLDSSNRILPRHLIIMSIHEV